MWLFLLLSFVVIWVLVQKWKRRKLNELFQQLKPKSLALPFFGHSYMFLGSNEDRMTVLKQIGEEAYEKGGLIAHWQGFRLYVVVADPEAAKVVLKSCLEKDEVIKCLRVLIGNGSIFAPVKIWRPRRKILTPIFSPKNLNQFVQVFAQQSGFMAKRLQEVVGKGSVSLWKYLPSYAMDSVCETTLGVQMKSQLQTDRPFLQAFEECCRLDAVRICQPWFYNDTLYMLLPRYKLHTKCKDFIINVMDQVIQTKKKFFELEQTSRNTITDQHKQTMRSFLELLLESSRSHQTYSNLELREETLVIVLAGTDTSAAGASFTLVMLSRHPEVQEKVQQELQEILGTSDSVTADVLPRLKYLDAVLKETLRLYPPVPFIVRKVEKDLTLPSGVTLVEGCGVFVSILAIHRNPKYWGEDANLFRPERFLDNPDRSEAFMPFSHGPRNCLGYQYAMMTMKTALATVLRQFRVLPAQPRDPTSPNDQPLRVKFDIMMKHVENFEIQLERINSCS